MSRRRRRRASDIATVRPRRGLGSLLLLAIGLGLIIVYKVGVGEGTAGFLAEVTGDPELALPPSVLDDDASPIGTMPLDSARPDATPPEPRQAAPADPPQAAPPDAALPRPDAARPRPDAGLDATPD